MRHKNEIELRLPGPFQRSHQAAIYGGFGLGSCCFISRLLSLLHIWHICVRWLEPKHLTFALCKLVSNNKDTSGSQKVVT